MIKDCFGIVPLVGDTIAFSRGNAGAKPFEKAIITKITDKTITFSGLTGSMYRDQSETLRRGEGCFVVDLLARTKGLIGKANAWDSVETHVKSLQGPAQELRQEVSADLHRDGCHSAATHVKYFIDELVKSYEEKDHE